jgi:hypothetical protein
MNLNLYDCLNGRFIPWNGIRNSKEGDHGRDLEEETSFAVRDGWKHARH